MSMNILLADDHAMMREGLRAILERDPDYNVVGEASDGVAALDMANELQPDVIVMDIAMPNLNGVEATRQILRRQPNVKIIALSTYSDRRYVLAMLEAGAYGYVVKAAIGSELLRALEAITKNQKYLSPEVSDPVVDNYLNRPSTGRDAVYHNVAPRERQVLQLLAEGKTSGEIAEVMGISSHTVDVHRRNIMRKLNLHSVAELTKYAVREGLTSLEH